MSDRLLLAGWLAAVVLISMTHAPAWLAGLLALVLAASGREAPALLKGVLPAVALVNIAVSAGVAIPAWLAERSWLEFVLRLNLRVVLLGVITLWLARHLRLERAVAGSPALVWLVTLVQGQIRSLRSAFTAARQGLASRSPEPLTGHLRYSVAARQVAVLIDKAEANAEALTLAMRARGALDRGIDGAINSAARPIDDRIR